jgi:hypothetical protein
MAYEAALAAGVEGGVLRLDEAEVMKADLSWHIENIGISRNKIVETEAELFTSAPASFPAPLKDLEAEVGQYCTAAILSEQSWHDFVANCQHLGKIQRAMLCPLPLRGACCKILARGKKISLEGFLVVSQCYCHPTRTRQLFNKLKGAISL